MRVFATPTLLLALLLSACSLPLPVPEPLSAEQGLPEPVPQPGERLYRLDAQASVLTIHVFRAGRAASLGHNHVLTAPRMQGWVLLPPSPQEAQLALALRLDELALDAPERRAALGPGWASALSPEAVAATRSNMLGEAGLQAKAFPWVRLRALRVVGELPKLAMQVEIELHGQKQTAWLALDVQQAAGQLRARGALVLRQSDFGLQAFSVGGGLLAVADELLLEFDLVAR